MALSLGKLSVLVGAGIVGSVLAKEGRIFDVSDVFSGALKIVLKQIRQDDSPSSNVKPRNDSLMQQVNSLQQELQLLASSRSIAIVTSSGSGSSRYGVVIIVIVVGSGYIWWKGWRLPDIMFATRRGLSDACATVSKQLEGVYSSISATKRHLSSRIDRVDNKIDECADNTAATREEVTELRGDVKMIGVDVQTVRHVVKSLETKISRIEGRQNETNFGLGKLIAFARNIESSRTTELIEVSPSKPALELPPLSPSSRAVSLPTNSSQDASSPFASNASYKRPLQTAVSASGLKELHEISDEGSSLISPQTSNGVHPSKETQRELPLSGLIGRTFSGISASFLTRNLSAVQSSK